jgi:hypothetical protein
MKEEIIPMIQRELSTQSDPFRSGTVVSQCGGTKVPVAFRNNGHVVRLTWKREEAE